MARESFPYWNIQYFLRNNCLRMQNFTLPISCRFRKGKKKSVGMTASWPCSNAQRDQLNVPSASQFIYIKGYLRYVSMLNEALGEAISRVQILVCTTKLLLSCGTTAKHHTSVICTLPVRRKLKRNQRFLKIRALTPVFTPTIGHNKNILNETQF